MHGPLTSSPKKLTVATRSAARVMTKDRLTHNEYQQALFAREVDSFCEPIPKEVQQRLRAIVGKVQLKRGERVLDVGTGTGVLIPLIRSYEIEDVVGCDLSSGMLTVAEKLHRDVTFWCGDVVDLPDHLGLFDVVFVNAVFGNLWDQRAALSRINEVLKQGGRICISHPLGSRYVAELQRSDPRRTPHTLPDPEDLLGMIYHLSLQLTHYEDERDLYVAVLAKTEAR